MAEALNSDETVLAALAHDAGFREFAGADAALLLWDLEGTRVLWASRSAAGLRETLTNGHDGKVSASFPAQMQLRALGQGLAPVRGARLERLRFDRSRLTAPITCACRRVVLPSGEEALLTAIVGPVPKLSYGRVARTALPPGDLAPADQRTADNTGLEVSPEEPIDVAGRSPKPGTVRFVWHTDAAGRFTYRSDALAEVVGPAGAAMIGRTWEEIAGELVFDPLDAVSDCLTRGETWSGATVLWRVADTDRAVPVNMAGAPILGRDREFLGFRGFGLCRTEIRSEWRLESRPDDSKPASASPDRSQGPLVEGLEGGPDLPPRGGAPRYEGSVGREQNNPVAKGASEARDVRPHEHLSLPHLSPEERLAFREIARALGARFDNSSEVPPGPGRLPAEIVHVHARGPAHAQTLEILDSLPIGLLIYRGETPLFANALLLDLVGCQDVSALARQGGLAGLFPSRWPIPAHSDGDAPPLMLSTLRNESLPVEVRLAALHWEGLPTMAMVVRRVPENDPAQRLSALELELRAGEARLRELTSILDTATDGVIVLDDIGRILSLNRSAEALFGYDQREIAGESVTMLLAAESQGLALDYLDGLRSSGVARLLNDGREVLGRVRQGGTIPLFMTVGRTSEIPERKFCVVLRDITALNKAEAELLAAKRAAEDASAEKSDFLAKVSHELRTPLNAIIGFAEIMLEERFGALGNERYRDYLKDIHGSGRRVIGLVTDLLDLAKIEAGRMELAFAGVNLNGIVADCVNAYLRNATRERIVIRTSFAPTLPLVVADERSVRQIVLNIVSNAVKFTPSGGQVIVSTAVTDRGEVIIRVRDTGVGMTDQEVEAALEPLRQLATARQGGGTGLGLPLTKALVEANRGALHITSAPNEGTLVEIVFPPTRVLAEQKPA